MLTIGRGKIPREVGIEAGEDVVGAWSGVCLNKVKEEPNAIIARREAILHEIAEALSLATIVVKRGI